jgi:hypothetical protein
MQESTSHAGRVVMERSERTKWPESSVQLPPVSRCPPGPLVVSLFNPFGAETLRRVLTSLSTQPRPVGDEVYVAYFNPVQEHVFEDFPEFVRTDGGVDWALYRLDPAVRGRESRASNSGASGPESQDRPATDRSGSPVDTAPVRPCPIAPITAASRRSPASGRWPSDCGPGRGRPWVASRRTHPLTLQVGGNPFGREACARVAGAPRKGGYCSVRTDHRGGARRPLPLGALAKPTM